MVEAEVEAVADALKTNINSFLNDLLLDKVIAN
jgi:hypothetical protein